MCGSDGMVLRPHHACVVLRTLTLALDLNFSPSPHAVLTHLNDVEIEFVLAECIYVCTCTHSNASNTTICR